MFDLKKQMRKMNTLVRCIPGSKQRSRKPISGAVLCWLTCPIKGMGNNTLRGRCFDLTVSAPKKQRSAEAVTVLGLSVARGVRNNSQMGGRTT